MPRQPEVPFSNNHSWKFGSVKNRWSYEWTNQTIKKEYLLTLPLTPKVNVTLKVTWSLYDLNLWTTQISLTKLWLNPTQNKRYFRNWKFYDVISARPKVTQKCPFYAPGLKGPPGASSNRIVCPSVCLSVRNSVPLIHKVQYLKFGWLYSNQTWTVSSSKGFSHFTDITCPWGWGGVNIWNLEILPYLDFIATGGIRVSQTHV